MGVDGHKHEVFALPYKQPCQGNSFSEDAVVAAFWWVTTTSNKKEANMALEVIQKNGHSIPVLKNTSSLTPGTKLVRFVSAKRPLDATTSSRQPKSQKGDTTRR